MAKQLPRISVITPSYNQGKFIRQTIESVFSQQYEELEYIIVDGASTDETLTILNDYRNKIILISEPDRGQTDAINKGLHLATGDIVCWLNSDDYFLPGTLNKIGMFFYQNPDKLWITADCLIVNDNNIIIQQPIRYYKRILRSISPTFYLGLTNAVCQPATFWRRSAHNQLGYLNEDLRFTMDYDWWLRLSVNYTPTAVDDVLAAFRIHQDSKGGSQFYAQFDEDYSTYSRYSTSKLIKVLHYWHNWCIKSIYALIK